MTKPILTAVFALAICAPQPGDHPSPYQFESLSPPFYAQQISVKSVNDFGAIVGTYQDQTGDHSFLLRNGVYKSFNVSFPNTNETLAEGINLEGTIVGSYRSPGSVEHGFVRRNGKDETVDYPSATIYGTGVRGVNDLGQIVGSYCDAGCYLSHGFVRSGTHFEQLDVPFPGNQGTLPTGINDWGEVVGWYLGADAQAHGFLYFRGHYSALQVPVPGAYSTQPQGINNLGQVVGDYTDANGNSHGFIWAGNDFKTIDAPSSIDPYTGYQSTFLYGINDNGLLVGTYGYPGTSFIATRSGH